VNSLQVSEMQGGQVSKQKQDDSLQGRSCPEDGEVHPPHDFIAVHKIILSPVSPSCTMRPVVCWPNTPQQEAVTCTLAPWGFPLLSC